MIPTPAESSPTGLNLDPAYRFPTLEDVEKFMVERALQRTRGNKTRAAKMLGICQRTLRIKLKAWGWDHWRGCRARLCPLCQDGRIEGHGRPLISKGGTR